MEAIQTHYGEYYFRSRLEARWAYFFDICKITYYYESEGFKDDGNMYLPDFHLPDTYFMGRYGLFAEIKNPNYVVGKEYLWFTQPLVVFTGLPQRNIYRNVDRGSYNGGFELYPEIDDHQVIWLCGKCGKSMITYESLSLNKCVGCDGVCDINLLQFAAQMATEVRF